MLEDGKVLILRGASQQARVSHAAPAYHFDGLNVLKTAMAAEGMRRFAALHASLEAYGQLHRICAPFVTDPAESWLIENAIWSMTHGYALLQMQNPIRNDLAPFRAPPLAQQFSMLLNREGAPGGSPA